MSVLDKILVDSKQSGAAEFACEPDGFGDDFPGLFEIIARQRWKGNPRKTGKLLLFTDYGKATLLLTDAHEGQCAFYKKDGFAEALEGLERALQEGIAPWRKDRRA